MKITKNWMRILCLAGAVAAGLLAMRYLLPLALPILVGLAVAMAAEPLAKLLCGRAGVPRGLASAIAICVAFAVTGGVLYLLGRLALGELDRLADQIPQVAMGLDTAAGRVRQWLQGLAQRAPEHLRPQIEAGIRELFESGTQLAHGAAEQVLGLASRIVLSLPDTLVFLGTAIASSFLISARLPRALPLLRRKLPKAWQNQVLPVLQALRVNVGGWFRAQLKLMGITFVLLTLGFLVLRVEHPVLIGAVVALVDALPMLGVGTILIPWGLLAMLQGSGALGLGLLALYAGATLTRSVLEPRMVGRQLGLSPLTTLAAVYAGYKLWGILGMILAPVLTITAAQIWAMTRPAA
ncbi:MAG: sporulation integral membrane protein YtvI [Faecousia sp.]